MRGRAASSGTTCSRRRSGRSRFWKEWDMPEAQEALAFPGPDYGNPDPQPEWMGIDWREHLQRLELPGATVNYAEVGSGEPILFVHGLAGCWRNWLENVPYFGRGYRAIALDLPGF